MHAPVELADIAADVLARIRDRAPRVHCITNTVAQNYTANMLLAAGAVPSMTSAAVRSALRSVRYRPRACRGCSTRFSSSDRWVARNLPVTCWRASQALCGSTPLSSLRCSVDPADEAASRMAQACTTVVALTGSADIVTDGARRLTIANGDSLMSRVTGMGCAGSALVCAALAVETDAWLATNAALIALGVAGEVAAQSARRPGRFASWVLDALHSLDRATLRARAKVS